MLKNPSLNDIRLSPLIRRYGNLCLCSHFVFSKLQTQTTMFVFFSVCVFSQTFAFCVLCLCFQSTLYLYTLRTQTQTTWFVFWGQPVCKFVFVFWFVFVILKHKTQTQTQTQNTNFANWGHCIAFNLLTLLT